MKKLYSKLSGQASERGYGRLMVTVFIFLFVHSCSFLYDGVGLSRVSGYWDDYNGHMSYSEIPARIRVEYINEEPADKYSWEVLQFGCKLDNKQEIVATVEQAGIPADDIQTIFYNPNSFEGLPLKPNTTYSVKLDINANYYSFLFKQQYGFAIYSWKELESGSTGEGIKPYPGWKWKYNLYALACWLQAGLLFAAIFFVYDAQTGNRETKKFASRLTTVFLISMLWVIYVDLPFFTSWADWILPGIGLVIGATMIVYLLIAFRNPDIEE